MKVSAKLAELVSKTTPNVFTCIGGPHITALPEETLKEFPSFDFGIYGEGEETIVRLVKSLNSHTPNLNAIANLVL